MITNFETTNVLNAQIMGLSTDTKPTTGVQPNSLFWELDTNGMYFFDGTQWQPIGGSGGGGGSGESDFSTAQVTLVGTWDTVISPIGIIDPGPGIAIVLPMAGEHTLVLYKGEQRLFPTTSEGQQISATGNATATFDVEYQKWRIIITGDCTLTITNVNPA